MAPPPPDATLPAAADSPIDRAFDLLLGGELEAALRWAAAVVRSEPGGPVGLLLTARVLGDLGHSAAALEAVRMAEQRALHVGNLPIAVAACLTRRDLGEDPAAGLDEIARSFARGSERLLPQGAQPPAMPHRGRSFKPLAAALGGNALIEEARTLLQEAREQLEAERPKRGKLPKVAPQPLFSALDVAGLRALLGILELLPVPTGQVLVEEGTQGSEAYVVARGELEIRRARSGSGGSGVRLARLGAGALLGEMSLLSRAPRAASAIACRPSLVLVASKHALDALVKQQPELGAEVADHCRRRMVENLVRTSAILRAVKPSERPALMERFVTRQFEAGEQLIAQGQESEGIFMIASGAVEVIHRHERERTVLARLSNGEVVGEVALVLRRPATADVIAAMPTVTLHLHRDRFLDLIKAHPTVLTELYELAVRRAEETSNIVALEAMDAEDLVLL